MDKVLGDIGLATRLLETVEPVIIEVNTMKRSVKPTVVTLLRDGRHSIKVSFYDNIVVLFTRKALINLMSWSVRYHVPRSWLSSTGNLLVIFEEWGGDPTGISMVKRSIGSVCADVSEWQPSMKNWHTKDYEKAKVHLQCDNGQKITEIKFASFGTPQGSCGSYSEGGCHAHKSYDIFWKVKDLRSLCRLKQHC